MNSIMTIVVAHLKKTRAWKSLKPCLCLCCWALCSCSVLPSQSKSKQNSVIVDEVSLVTLHSEFSKEYSSANPGVPTQLSYNQVVMEAQRAQLASAIHPGRVFITHGGTCYLRDYAFWRFGSISSGLNYLYISLNNFDPVKFLPPQMYVIPFCGGFMSQWKVMGEVRDNSYVVFKVVVSHEGDQDSPSVIGSTETVLHSSNCVHERDLLPAIDLPFADSERGGFSVSQWQWPHNTWDALLTVTGKDKAGKEAEDHYLVSRREPGHAGRFIACLVDPADIPETKFRFIKIAAAERATLRWFPPDSEMRILSPYP